MELEPGYFGDPHRRRALPVRKAAQGSAPPKLRGPSSSNPHPQPEEACCFLATHTCSLQVKSGRPLATDRIVAVPSGRGDSDRVKDAHPCGCRVRHLNDSPRGVFIAEIDETTPRAVALLSHRVAGSQGAPVNLVIVLRPARPMLHALMAGGKEVAVHA